MKTKHMTVEDCLLFSLDEMTDEDKKRAIAHLSTCEMCRENLKQNQSVILFFKTHPGFEADDESLTRVRSRLHNKLREARNGFQSRRNFEWIETFFTSNLTRKLASAAALFLLGIGVGHFGYKTNSSGSSSLTAEVKTLITRAIPANIQILSNKSDPGWIEIQFQSIENHVIRGRLDDREIQEAVGFALMWAPKDNIRLAALNQIACAPKAQPLEDALLFSAENDPNPGVRLKAIQMLNTFPVSDGIKQMLISTFLNEEHSGIRIEAANGLSRIADASILPLIKEKAGEDAYIQYLLTQAHENTTNNHSQNSDI